MSNYFDNQSKWSWDVSQESVLVTTDHGNHTHTLNVTDVPIGEMADHTGKVMGEAHRAVPHDYKDSKMSVDVKVKSKEEVKMSEKNDFLESLKVDRKTQEKLNEVLKNYNNSEKKTAKKADDGGRERGDEGPGKLGRDSGLKSGSKVTVMRADMKANNSMNQPKGQLSQNGQAVANSGKAASPNPAGQIFSGKTGIGSNNGGISGNPGANGGHGSTGGFSGTGGGHGSSGSSGSSGGSGGHGGSSGGSGGGHGGSGGTGGHGGH